MVERRSLGAALQLPPEQEAFIREGVAPPAQATIVMPKAEPVEPTQPKHVGAEPAPEPEKPRVATRPNRTNRGGQAWRPPSDFRESLDAFTGITKILVPLTTKLQPSTTAALKRAVLEQKLRGRNPATVQEIAEEAIAAWLRTEGFLP